MPEWMPVSDNLRFIIRHDSRGTWMIELGSDYPCAVRYLNVDDKWSVDAVSKHMLDVAEPTRKMQVDEYRGVWTVEAICSSIQVDENSFTATFVSSGEVTRTEYRRRIDE